MAAPARPTLHTSCRVMVAAACLAALLPGAWAACEDSASCQAHVKSLTDQLAVASEDARGKTRTLQALEELRTGILTGNRIELPSAQRQHLENGSPMISQISFDARHKPVSTNVSRHFTRLRTLAPDVEVRLHAFMPLKRSSSPSQKGAPSAMVAMVDAKSKFSVFGLDGEAVLADVDLGHAPGAQITQMLLSPNQDNHFVLTADDKGEIRVHNMKVIAKMVKKEDAGEDGAERQKKQFTITTNFSCTFSLPEGPGGEVRKLNSVLPIERGPSIYFVTGDSMGGIAVFQRNGTMKGRVKVTEDPGGVSGLLRSQGQMILFWSSHTFGFFSSTQIDVTYPPCSGWNSPLYDVSLDPSPSSSSGRVLLSLMDGDVLVYSTTKGKGRACDLSLKFPHVSNMPFKLHSFRGHVVALPTPPEGLPRKEDYPREVLFFNMAAMEAGYGTAPSRAVSLQASFSPKMPLDLSLNRGPTGGSSLSSSAAGGKTQVVVRFEGVPGLELFDLSLKQPPAPKAAQGGGGDHGDDSSFLSSSWLSWFPKVGVFGMALVGVVIWNVRKVTNQRKQDTGNLDDFDDELFKERLKERRMKREMDKGFGSTEDKGDVMGKSEEPPAEEED